MDSSDLSVVREESSLRHQVINRLRQAILAGRFAPGQRLVERDLCQSLGISRPLLRESMQHLKAEGLITIVPHRGPVVATIDATEAREIYEVRQSLEALAAEGFARRASPVQRQRLRASLEHLRTPEASATTEARHAAKNAFYAILLEGCGNRVVGQMLTQLNNRVTLLRRRSLGQPGRLPETLAELELVVGAIEAGDAQRAGALCSAHVARAAQVVMRSFET